jgi:hypothetical protein
LLFQTNEKSWSPVMKAMSIKQPWVHVILHKGKDIENRTWQRNSL